MTLQKPKAILFDWDDTIVDNWQIALFALNTALTHMGHTPWSDEEARANATGSAKDIFGKLFGDKWQEADRVYYETFCTKVLSENSKFIDNAEQILEFLRDNEIYLAVVSNKRGPLLRNEVQHSGLAGYFNKIVGAGDAARDKPNPEPIYLALEGSGIEPGPDVWFIGDAHTDIACAINAGCTGILIETKLPPQALIDKHPPAGRVKDHSQLMELIKPYFT